MLEKPDLQDEAILACVRADYGIAARAIEFLPLGYDPHAGVYRVTADDGADYFLKVKQGGVDAVSLSVPRFLSDQGIEQVVAPLPTGDGRLNTNVDAFAVILYPYVEGESVMDAGMPDAQWIQLGAVVRKMHSLTLPRELASQIRREDFVPPKIGMLRAVDAQIQAANGVFEDAIQRQMVDVWQQRRERIVTIADRAEAYGKQLEARKLPFVLCHADIHTANVLIDHQKRFHIVDWDGAMFAPKERDLMFVTGAGAGGMVAYGERVKTLFFEGYGEAEVDSMALAYYRCDWVVQDIGEFAHSVFNSDDGDETRANNARLVRGMFNPGETVEVAEQTVV